MNYYEAKQLLNTVKVQVCNEFNSKKIQEKLFSLDFGWHRSREKVIQHLDQPFLYISSGRIGFGTSKEVFNKSNYREISINDILDINVDENYRPFINSKECWEEMQKHEPFGWVLIGNDEYRQIDKIIKEGLLFRYDEPIRYWDAIEGYFIKSFEEACTELRFADGTIVGIKLEE